MTDAGSSRLSHFKNLYNYHETARTFPPGLVMNTDGVYMGWGWGVQVLPYLDASPFYFNISETFKDGLQVLPDIKDLGWPHTAFQCPSNLGSSVLLHAMVSTTPVVDGVATPGTVDWSNHLGRSMYFGNAGYLQADAGGIHHDSSGEPPSTEPHLNRASLGNIGISKVFAASSVRTVGSKSTISRMEHPVSSWSGKG